jgi:hypothetical protein
LRLDVLRDISGRAHLDGLRLGASAEFRLGSSAQILESIENLYE